MTSESAQMQQSEVSKLPKAVFDFHDSAVELFNELKSITGFVFKLGDQFGLTNNQTKDLKEKIESMFLILDKAAIEISLQINLGIDREAEFSPIAELPTSQSSASDDVVPESLNVEKSTDETLYVNYNKALSEIIHLNSKLTELSLDFNNLTDKVAEQNQELKNKSDQIECIQKENSDLMQQLNGLQAENAKLKAMKTMKNIRQVSSVERTDHANVQGDANLLRLHSKTADDLANILNQLFTDTDEVVQLIKGLYHADEQKKRDIVAEMLNKTRDVRQELYNVLCIFKKERSSSKISDLDVRQKVASELDRIYKTLLAVKRSSENTSMNTHDAK